jgi:hypothetical protein
MVSGEAILGCAYFPIPVALLSRKVALRMLGYGPWEPHTLHLLSLLSLLSAEPRFSGHVQSMAEICVLH